MAVISIQSAACEDGSFACVPRPGAGGTGAEMQVMTLDYSVVSPADAVAGRATPDVLSSSTGAEGFPIDDPDPFGTSSTTDRTPRTRAVPRAHHAIMPATALCLLVLTMSCSLAAASAAPLPDAAAPAATVAMLQLHRNASRLATATAAVASAAAAGADVAVLPGRFFLSTSDAKSMAAVATAHGIVVGSTCCDGATAGTPAKDTDMVWVFDGARGGAEVLTRGVYAPQAPLTGPYNQTVAVVQLRGGADATVAILTDGDLMLPMVARIQMLRGAELFLVPSSVGATSEPGTGVAAPSDAVLYARGFENVAVLARATSAGASPAHGRAASALHGAAPVPWTDTTSFSAAYSYCASLYPSATTYVVDTAAADAPNVSGTPPHVALLHAGLGDAPPAMNCTITRDTTGAPGLVTATYRPDKLRAARAVSIWGDGFRHPWAYRELCGVPQPNPQRTAAEHTNAAGDGDDKAAGGAVNVTVALLQLSAGPTPSGCADMAEAAIRQAAAAGADVALMPEMYSVGYGAFFPGYNGTHDNLRGLLGWTDLASPTDGVFVARFKALAAELGIAIAATYLQSGAAEEPGHPPRNAVTLFDRFGKEVYTYQKVHTCDWALDEALTEPGRNFRVGMLNTKAGNISVGSMICADREFPESAALLARHGAQLVLVPNACGLGLQQLHQFRARAVEQHVAVAMSNYAASQGMNGQSIAFDAAGTLVGYGGSEEGVYYAHVSVDGTGGGDSHGHGGDGGGGSARSDGAGHAVVDNAIELCDPRRKAAFNAHNVFHRVGGSTI